MNDSPSVLATPRCDIPECQDEAKHRPVLVLHNGGNRACARIPLPVLLCDFHRKVVRPEGFLDDAGWNSILASADAAGKRRPKRSLTDLVFIAPDALEFTKFTAPRHS